MLSFDYTCDYCGTNKSNEDMDSFLCECGGSMRLNKHLEASVFHPFYSRELKALVTSPKEEERLLKEKGLSYLSDHKGMVKEAAYIRRHKDELAIAEYDKLGVRYKGGSNTAFDEKTGEFVSRQTRQRVSRRTYFTSILLLLLCASAHAKIEGVAYTDITVNGKTYEVPMANKEYVADLILVKKMLRGDREARELLLSKYPDGWFFIGDEGPRWLRFSEVSEEVVIP